MISKNIFYFAYINKIGGIETFFYQLAKKYKDWDITIYYSDDTSDREQIKRLKQFVRVKQYKGEKIVCDKAFFNFNTGIIDNIEAKEYCLLLHGDYKDMLKRKQIYNPPTHPKINKYYGVSKLVCDSFKEVTGIEAELIYNPIEIDKPNKVINLISATRLTKEKGKDRIIQLANKLDEKNIPYIWTIFTDDTDIIENPNIIYMKPRLDITNYIANSNYLVQLSDNEGYCYSVVESLILGIPVIATKCPVFDEIGLNDTNSIKLDFDLSNIDDVIDKMVKGNFNFKYKPKDDTWGEILEKGKSTYQDEIKKKYLVEALSIYEDENISDFDLGRIPKTGEQWVINSERLEILLENNKYKKPFIKVIKEVKD